MSKEELIKKVEEIKKYYYDEYTFYRDDDSLDIYAYLKNLNLKEMKVEELEKIIEEYNI